MVETKTLNIVVGILSLLVLGCGISFAAVTAVLLNRISELSSYATTSSYWMFGFVYGFSGIIGLVSFCNKARGSYTAHMVVGIITLVLKTVAVIYAFLAMEWLTVLNVNTDNCYDVFGKCQCSYGLSYNLSCGQVSSLYSMFIGICSIIIIGWILTLINTIIAGILRTRHPLLVGIVLQSPSTTQVHMSTVHGMPNYPAYPGYAPPAHAPPTYAPPTYAPPTHDQAQLVPNMEYQPGTYKK